MQRALGARCRDVDGDSRSCRWVVGCIGGREGPAAGCRVGRVPRDDESEGRSQAAHHESGEGAARAAVRPLGTDRSDRAHVWREAGARRAGAYFTGNLSHDLEVERCYDGRPEGIFKTFELRRIKDSPPYLHDGRLLTLEDSVEFFNLVLGVQLTTEEQHDLVAYLRVL